MKKLVRQMTDQKNVINEKYEKKESRHKDKERELSRKWCLQTHPYSHLLVAHIPIPKGKNIMPGKEEEK